MRRLALAAAVLAATVGPAARAEPLDVDLSRLGPADTQDARTRFALLSSELALALSSAILQPASTTGFTGFAVDLEAAATPVSRRGQVWPIPSAQPSMLYVPAVHARKGLPFSFELGGRLLYLAMSNAYAAQAEAKWALNEGFAYVPDVAVRGAYTRLFGVKDWALSTADLDLLVSKRFALLGVTSLTPYVAARLTWISASSDAIASAADPAVWAAFPTFGAWLYRTTLGLRYTVSAVSLAVEGTWFAGAKPSPSGYGGVSLPSSLGGAAKLGWEW